MRGGRQGRLLRLVPDPRALAGDVADVVAAARSRLKGTKRKRVGLPTKQ
jgi:hypothetical protein